MRADPVGDDVPPTPSPGSARQWGSHLLGEPPGPPLPTGGVVPEGGVGGCPTVLTPSLSFAQMQEMMKAIFIQKVMLDDYRLTVNLINANCSGKGAPTPTHHPPPPPALWGPPAPPGHPQHPQGTP